MNNKQVQNENKIFDAIQELKDSIFGLTQPYTNFCYSYSLEDGYTLDLSKLETFSISLTNIAKDVKYYDASFAPVLPLFFKMTVMFLAAACNPSDWLFLSIKKIGKTVYKASTEDQSVFDIMVKNSSSYINDYYADQAFQLIYSEFSAAISTIEMTNFAECVKRTVERFIDENELNPLNDDIATQNIIGRIHRNSLQITRDNQKHFVPKVIEHEKF